MAKLVSKSLRLISQDDIFAYVASPSSLPTIQTYTLQIVLFHSARARVSFPYLEPEHVRVHTHTHTPSRGRVCLPRTFTRDRAEEKRLMPTRQSKGENVSAARRTYNNTWGPAL